MVTNTIHNVSFKDFHMNLKNNMNVNCIYKSGS